MPRSLRNEACFLNNSLLCIAATQYIFHGLFRLCQGHACFARVLGQNICPDLGRLVTWSGLARNNGGDCISVRLQNHVKNIASC